MPMITPYIVFDLFSVFIDDGVRVGVGPQRGFKFSVRGPVIEVFRAFSSRSSMTQTFVEGNFEVDLSVLMFWRYPT